MPCFSLWPLSRTFFWCHYMKASCEQGCRTNYRNLSRRRPEHIWLTSPACIFSLASNEINRNMSPKKSSFTRCAASQNSDEHSYCVKTLIECLSSIIVCCFFRRAAWAACSLTNSTHELDFPLVMIKRHRIEVIIIGNFTTDQMYGWVFVISITT